MLSPASALGKTISVVLTFSMVTLGFPIGEFFKGHQSNTKPNVKPTPPMSKPLSAKEMRTMQGKWARNPYAAGSAKWDPIYKGVDLFTGNFSLSATDMTFEGGYGIPVNVTRSYSANNIDESPLGIGWTLSVDIRSTAGGLLKSSKSPVRAVPVGFKERPLDQEDPNAVSANGTVGDPVEAVLSTDAAGQEETQQKDVDGIITTPPWDKNTNDPTYEMVTNGSNTYRVLTGNTVKTPDGTSYVYTKHGYYWNGSTPEFSTTDLDGTLTHEPSNVLKIDTATDRQGNVTNYHYYSSGAVTLAKTNGNVVEDRLQYILMPNGHQINFTWGTGSKVPTNRIAMVDDNIASPDTRQVVYEYNVANDLAKVYTPTGLETDYGYGDAVEPGGGPVGITGSSAILNSITDPRGLTTTIAYTYQKAYFAPTMVGIDSIRAYRIVAPNGNVTLISSYDDPMPSDGYVGFSNFAMNVAEYAPGASTPYYVVGGDGRVDTGTTNFYVWDEGNGAYSGAQTLFGPGSRRKIFNTETQDLTYEANYTSQVSSLASNRYLVDSGDPYFTLTEQETEYNFIGNPLSKTVTESHMNIGGSTNERIATVEYAYWGQDKYFQQKAVKDQAGRYSYTDYFDSSAAAGKKGQTYRVYDDARVSSWTTTGSGAPSGTPSGDLWKYYLAPASGPYSAEFDYDSKGRPIDVWKLQKIVSGTPSYVQTHTTYGADNDGSWGQASEVVEDYGSGKINRTTTTLHYTSDGKADQVEDAAGHVFETDYDLDGKVNSVTRTDPTPDVPVVTYTYGTSGITNGQVTQVVDNLSGETQDFAYNDGSSSTAGNVNYIGGIGQVKSITETDASSNAYSTNYTYTAQGDRDTALYSTPNGDTKWAYSDYLPVGDSLSPSRVFQTLNKLSYSGGTWSPSTEEFHYAYLSSGALKMAAFAQTPESGQTSYSSAHEASTRAVSLYRYDAGGRLYQLDTGWQTWTNPPMGLPYYATDALVSNTCTYEKLTSGSSNLNRGLKLTSNCYLQDPSNHANYALDHQDVYGYDADLDYLTSASYNGGSTTTNWTYDAAGNRNDASVVDNLNRATTIGGVSRTYDILGNTLTKGSSDTYSWDALNRMTQHVGAATTNYVYRADGMRTKKDGTTTDDVYYYDGQMQMEELETTSLTSNVTRYGLGARGVDYITKTTSGGTAVSFPIYDAHGSMVATVARGSGGTYVVGNIRWYDAWGGVLSGSTTGDPKGRYCANLGHVQDDESGLVYMRARYYEPGTGRFVSEDIGRNGKDWYVYCSNDPINKIDLDGHEDLWNIGGILRKAYSIFANSPRGYGIIKYIQELRQLQESLRMAAKVSEMTAGEMVKQAEVDAEFNGSEYDADAIAMKIEVVADQAAASALPITDALLAKVGIAMIDRMIELMLLG